MKNAKLEIWLNINTIKDRNLKVNGFVSPLQNAIIFMQIIDSYGCKIKYKLQQTEQSIQLFV